MLFEYLVVSGDGAQQKGQIEAVSENEAKTKLNDMGLTVLTLSVLKKDQKVVLNDTKLSNFIFLGIDEENEEVEGSIEADSELSAYKRLIEEYGLNLKWIVDNSLPKAVQESKKVKSIMMIEALAYERGLKIKKNTKVQKVNEEDVVERTDTAFLMKQREKQRIIDEISKTVAIIIDKVIKFKAPGTASDLEKKISGLQKIKMTNNLILIEEISDEIINNVFTFFEKWNSEKPTVIEDLNYLGTLSSKAAQAKMKKFIYDARVFLSFYHDKFKKALNLKPKDTTQTKLQDQIVNKLSLEQREIIYLLFYHTWGYLIKTAELKQKHKEAYLKLWKQFKSIRKKVEQTHEEIKLAREFDRKNFAYLIDDINYFASWLLAIYLLFLAIAEISIVKSVLLPVNFVWQILQSNMIISIIFALFCIVLISPTIKQKFSRYLLTILLSYLGVLGLSVLVYFNY